MLTVGFSIKVFPVADNPAPGFQVYALAPLALSIAKVPEHIVTDDGVTLTCGDKQKSVALIAVIPPTSTAIFPVEAPNGTVVVIVVPVLAVTVDFTPFSFTVLLRGFILKFVPVIVIDVPIFPPAGLKFEIVGENNDVDAYN